MNILRLPTLSLIMMLVIPLGAYAHNCPDHAHCDKSAPPSDDDVVYSVTIDVDMMGASDHDWRGNFGGKKTIGLNDAGPDLLDVGEFSDLSFFAALPPDPTPPFDAGQGANCFSSASAPFTIHQGSVSKGRGGRAQAGFFFHGLTNDGNVTVLYGLQLIGEFASGAEVEWPPSDGGDTVLNIATWELSATNEGKDIKSISCIGEGATNVTITVTGPL